MAVLREQIVTSLGVDEAFRFVSDFANSMHWDPGVATSEAIDDGPVRVGSRYRVGIRRGDRVTPMEYRVTRLEPTTLVVLEGSSSSVQALDEIGFAPTPDGGTVIDYTATLHLRGLMRLLEPFAGRAFAKIGRDAREGMQRTLDRMAGESRALSSADKA